MFSQLCVFAVVLCMVPACTEQDGQITPTGNSSACQPQCRPCKRGFPPTSATNWFEIAGRPEVVKKTADGLWDRVCLSFRPQGNSPMKLEVLSLWGGHEYVMAEKPEVRTYQCHEFGTWLRTCFQRLSGKESPVVVPIIDLKGYTCAGDIVSLQVVLDYVATRPWPPEDRKP